MNKTLIGVGLLVVLVILFFAFGRGEKKASPESISSVPENTSQTSSASIKDASYIVVKEESSVGWEGRKTLIVNYSDKGTLSIQDGSFKVVNGAVTEGALIFDMSSIATLSTGGGSGQDKLTGHLKSADFFDVANFPTAELKIKEAKSSDGVNFLIRGDLTIKGKTNAVEIPATLGDKGGKLEVKGVVSLDRTLWDIRYGSDKFFDNLANNVIDDMFTVTFSLIAQ